MPKIEITQSHKDTAAVPRTSWTPSTRSWPSSTASTSRWVSDTEAKVERTGASGHHQDRADEVRVNMDLSFALSPIKGKVEEKIKDELKKLFG